MHNAASLTYGEGRTMQSPDFEIYHFFDSRPSNIHLHHHDFFELYYLRSGEMNYIVDGQHYILHPGNLLFIAPDQFHRPDVMSTSDFERFVLWIHPAFMNSALEHLPGLSADLFSGARISNFLCLNVSQRETLEMLLSSLEQESCSSQAYRQTMCHAILIALIIHVKRMMIDLPQADRPSFAAHSPAALHPVTDISGEQLREVFSYIQNHLSEDLSTSALAERFFFNPNTLARRFKKHAGIPIGDYVRKKRLATARLLIYQGMNTVQAGTVSGFSDYSTFYRAFRQEYGASPKAFAASCHIQS